MKGMRDPEGRESIPELKELVVQASQALALLDATRLEELALSCDALNRDLALETAGTNLRDDLARQAQEAEADLAVFGRVLNATRENLNVMKRLREMRLGELEYKTHWGAPDQVRNPAEGGNGDH
jgi:hypothetical protein